MNEVAPPGQEAEDFITGHKDEFKKRYGKDWERVLYATAWKKFGESSQPAEQPVEETEIDEKWKKRMKSGPKVLRGRWDDYSRAQLKIKQKRLRAKEHRTSEETATLRSINLALRARKAHGGKWKGVKAESINEDMDTVYVVSVDPGKYYSGGGTQGSTVDVTLLKGNEVMRIEGILIWEDNSDQAELHEIWNENQLNNEGIIIRKVDNKERQQLIAKANEYSAEFARDARDEEVEGIE